MIETVVTGLSWLCIAVGSFFVLVAGLGLLRMPDVFTRMHAGGMVDTAGAGLILVGMMLAGGFSLISAKLLIILLVILFTGPIATHALAQAALHAGVDPVLADPPEKETRSRAKRASAGQGGKPRRRAPAKKTGRKQPSKR